MRKMTVALSAIALLLSTVALPAAAATKPAKDGLTASESTAPKKRLVRKAKPTRTAKYSNKCKRGERWDAQATTSAGACVKKARVKSASKSAKPSSRSTQKKIG